MRIVFKNKTEEEDFFCWSVHLIIVNRRKTIVMLKDSNRFGFVLYGLKAPPEEVGGTTGYKEFLKKMVKPNNLFF